MASFWGEILPVSSRAVNEDDDDDDGSDSETTTTTTAARMKECDMIWNPELREMESLACRLLVVADGEAAVQFVDAAILWRKDSILAGVLNSGFVQSESQFPPKTVEFSKSCTIHHLRAADSCHRDVVVVRNTAHVFPEQLHSWQRQLFARLNFRAAMMETETPVRVVVLGSANVINYLEGPSSASRKGNLGGEPPFLRALVNDAASASSSSSQPPTLLPHLPCPLLETPNIVDGVVAQLLTGCQVARLPAAAFVVFAQARLETATIEAFAPLLMGASSTTRCGGVGGGGGSVGASLHGLVETNPEMKRNVREFILKRDAGSLLYT